MIRYKMVPKVITERKEKKKMNKLLYLFKKKRETKEIVKEYEEILY